MKALTDESNMIQIECSCIDSMVFEIYLLLCSAMALVYVDVLRFE